jgi:hypothetical protein
MRQYQKQAGLWLALSFVIVTMVIVVVMAPARATPLRTVDVLLLFGGGFAAGAALVRGIMARQRSR